MKRCMDVADYSTINGREKKGEVKIEFGIDESLQKNLVKFSKIEDNISTELTLLQVMDLAIFSTKVLSHFKGAYRYEKLYDENTMSAVRVGLQGGAATLKVSDIENLKEFSSVLSKDGELIGERIRELLRSLVELEY